METKKGLPKELIDAGFKLTKDAPLAFFDQQLGDINFTTITLEKAEELVEAKCTYIQKTGKRSTPEA